MITNMQELDDAMLDFFKSRIAAGSETPLEDTEMTFGEDATWCIAASAMPKDALDALRASFRLHPASDINHPSL